MKKPILALLPLFLSGALSAAEVAASREAFEPTWTSLCRHDTPHWLEDAKFGIYCHWGLRSVKNLPEHADKHVREVIPHFTAESFDPEAWAELFEKAGAEFAGPVAWHGSGFLHWDSNLTPWNSMNMGPKRDIVGELATAIKARGLKLLTSFHFGYHWSYEHWSDDPEYSNPEYASLYGPIHDTDATGVVKWKNHIIKQERMSPEHMQSIAARIEEAVRKYQPDIVWVDTSFGGTTLPKNRGRYAKGRLLEGMEIVLPGLREREQRQIISFFFNDAAKSGREVEFVYKTWDLPPGIGMRNVENGLLDELTYDPWMTDIDMNIHVGGVHSWFFKEGSPVKSANYLIDMLVDVVSKNGRMLLDVPPRADGTFSPEIVREIMAVGDWLAINGEAIRGASPWYAFGEGPTMLEKVGHYSDSPGDNHFGKGDIRFTVKGNALYATLLAWPGDEAVMRTLGSRGRLFPGDIEAITLLGRSEPLKWKQTRTELTVEMPPAPVSEHAHVLKIVSR